MKVLIAPLNWGLGHATRVIPIIREIERQGAEVILASDGKAYDLLQKEFPNHELLELPTWNITYPTAGSFTWHLLKQSKSVLKSIRKENVALEKIVADHSVDVVISDNRLGCYSKNAVSVILTHQVFIQSPVVGLLLNWINHLYLKKFLHTWVIDFPGINNLSGKLSHAGPIPFSHRFIGLLSRFTIEEPKDENGKIGLLAIISGPEPQRTLFEKEILPQMENLPYKTVALLGKPRGETVVEQRGNLTVYSHLNSNEIEALMNNADVIVSRTGYTTVMDIVLMKKKAILIPTPGQTEQEYLAKYYAEKGWFVSQRQGKIDLNTAVKKALLCTLPELPQTDYLVNAITDLLKSVE